MTSRPADGVVLAGGHGRRLGYPKAGARLGDTTLAAHAAAILTSRCRTVVAVGRPEVPLPVLPVPVVHDGPGPDAPLTGIVAGLSALTADRVVVLACDLPLAAALVDRLLAAPGHRARVAVDAAGRPQPLCAVYPRREALRAATGLLAAGRVRAMELIEALGWDPEPARGDELLNVNTEADLARCASHPASGTGPGAPPAPATT